MKLVRGESLLTHTQKRQTCLTLQRYPSPFLITRFTRFTFLTRLTRLTEFTEFIRFIEEG